MSVIKINDISFKKRKALMRFTVSNILRKNLISKGSVLILGQASVNCNIVADVKGVCPEAPLPRLVNSKLTYKLSGACGISELISRWGLKTKVICNLGNQSTSSKVRSLMSKANLSFSPFNANKLIGSTITTRIFADGIQLAHFELNDLRLNKCNDININNIINTFSISQNTIFCIVDPGEDIIDTKTLESYIISAKKNRLLIYYEPRSINHRNIYNLKCDILKINDNQLYLYYKMRPRNDKQALNCCISVIKKIKAKFIIYTRGNSGILIVERSGNNFNAIYLRTNKMRLYDLVSAGDIATASLLYGFINFKSIEHVGCFAISAVELGLDSRFNKTPDMLTIINNFT